MESTVSVWAEPEIQRLILQSLEDFAVLGIDLTGMIRTCNAGAQRILGYSVDELVGKGGYILFPREDYMAGAAEREMLDARDAGKALDERWHVKKGGHKFWASGIMYALRDDSGTHIGYAKIFRDLSRRFPHAVPAASPVDRQVPAS